jgi:hypothetical protein
MQMIPEHPASYSASLLVLAAIVLAFIFISMVW